MSIDTSVSSCSCGGLHRFRVVRWDERDKAPADTLLLLNE